MALDKSKWITPHEKPDYYGPDTRKWSVIMSIWGSTDVFTVGAFDSWDDAEGWAEYWATAFDAKIYGIGEVRRAKGNDLADRRRPTAEERKAAGWV